MLSTYLLLCLSLFGEVVPFDAPNWTYEAKEAVQETWLGKPALKLRGGTAYLKDIPFRNGIIEYNQAVTGKRGFMGALWRMQSPGNFEDFYIRPHNSGKVDANQYTPVFNGIAGWQLYHGPAYGKPATYPLNEWFHVKILVSGQQAEIYIGDMEQPVLFVPELKRPLADGLVGLKVGNPTFSHFADFRVTPMDEVKLKGKAPESTPIPEGIVKRWRVSNPFASKELTGYQLNPTLVSSRSWQDLAAEETGITNLARINGISKAAETVFARLDLEADKQRTIVMDFGYSDRAKVYLNGRLVYGGNNRYVTRDYRYLGTIGLFDKLYLPLEKGSNRVLLAVSEAFGGWGVIAALRDADGVKIR